MATRHKQVMQNGTSKENNALQRILHLPVVNSACNSLRKTYATTKEAHPLMASLCSAYERGLQSASSLAAWSMRPVVQKLEPQFAVANVLACQGLDHLEQKIPALHKPLEEVTSDLKESILTQIQKSMHIIVGILNKAMGLAAENYERPKNSVKATVEYARSSQVSQVAEAGAEAVTGKLEKLMDFFLPKEETRAACGPPGTSVPKEIAPSTTFEKVTALAISVSQHVYKQTVQTIQLVKDKGQELATWIPGLDHLARQSRAKIQWVLSGGWNTATDWLRKSQRRLQKKEEEAKKEGDQARETAKSTMGRLAQNLHTAYLSTVLLVKNAPFIAWNTAGQLLHVSTRDTVSEAGAKVGILQGIAGKLLGTIIHYVPLPNALEEEEETATSDQVETSQEEDDAWLVATLRLQERRRSSRGHYPIPFLNLDDPPEQAPSQRHRSPAFEAEYTGSRKSAFSPYREGAGRRRWSEGLFRPPPEVTYTRAQYTGLYSTTPKKD
ncbi:perilipin-1 isoform X1 [Sceloporus undulatus]|uniref:perilipin-1 isoform X1 n=1 Tax=Sceloporus undulatus TaxID=8520 RepID=UPI001C4C9CFC|nr:perilipin-1 isoform X1 [Sceloporus undulatus]XP_042332204.1 perilipin-1 isoform X1 [Sceloporus undulatus]